MIHFRELIMTFISKAVLHQALAIITLSLNAFHEGIGDAWLAPTLSTLERPGGELHFTTDDSSWIASVSYIGYTIGSLLTALLLDKVGRKCVTTTCSILFVIVWLGILFSKTVWLVCYMRILWGISNGAATGSDSFYIGEVTSPTLRGVFETLYLCFYCTGLCGEYFVVTYFSYKATALLNTAFAFLAVVSAFWMVESPHYLLLKGDLEQAEHTFLYLKGVSELGPFADEFERIKQNVQFKKTKTISYKAMLTSSVNLKTLLFVVLLYVLFNATGAAPIMNFSSLMFSSTQGVSEKEFTILTGVSQLFFSLLAVPVVRRCNRRSLLRITFSLVALNHLGTAILLYINDRVIPVPHFPWVIFASVSVYLCVIVLAYPAIFALRGELLPLSIKAFAGFIICMCKSLANFILSLEFLHIAEDFGTHANFLIYSLVSAILVVFLHFCIPETRNKSLTRIQDDLHNRNHKQGTEITMQCKTDPLTY